MNTIYMPMIRKAKTFPLGTATYSGWFSIQKYIETLANFQELVPEVGGGYWWIYGRDMGWCDMDTIVQYAETNKRSLLYHCLRWCWEEQPISLGDIETWINEVMNRYPTIKDWIVVNEGYIYYSGEQSIPYLEDSFEIARRNMPDARLWYNGLLFMEQEQEPVKELVSNGLCDAVGIQMHHDINMAQRNYEPFIAWLKEHHVPWKITELDVGIPLWTDENLQTQATMFQDAIALCIKYGGLGVNLWGISDAVSWLAAAFPTPFDTSYNPKPAWKAITDILHPKQGI